jgi:hypothetical protein
MTLDTMAAVLAGSFGPNAYDFGAGLFTCFLLEDISAVPEPASVALLLGFFAGAALRFRRGRAAK